MPAPAGATVAINTPHSDDIGGINVGASLRKSTHCQEQWKGPASANLLVGRRAPWFTLWWLCGSD